MSTINVAVAQSINSNSCITPEQFMEWAKRDLDSGDRRAAVNALSNVKRAVHAKVDEVLWALRVEYSRDWPGQPGIDDKLKALKRIKVPTSAIVKVLTERRNWLEHRYRPPRLDDVRSDVEAANLWLEKSALYPRSRIVIGGLPTTLFSTIHSSKRQKEGVQVESAPPVRVVFFWDARRQVVEMQPDGSVVETPFSDLGWKELIDAQRPFILDSGHVVPRRLATRIFRAYEKWVSEGKARAIKLSTPFT
jgi:hypothetical protein